MEGIATCGLATRMGLNSPTTRGAGVFTTVYVRERGLEIYSGTQADGLERLKTPVETSLWSYQQETGLIAQGLVKAGSDTHLASFSQFLSGDMSTPLLAKPLNEIAFDAKNALVIADTGSQRARTRERQRHHWNKLPGSDPCLIWGSTNRVIAWSCGSKVIGKLVDS